MLAAVADRYGPPDVVSVREVPRPTPRADQVLVQVASTAVNSSDARIRGARFPSGFGVPARLALGVRRPRRSILGSCFSGVVAAVGAEVQGTEPGDEVCGMTGAAMGAHAEFVAAPTRALAAKPPEVGHDDAAGLLFGATTASYFLRDRATVSAGAQVLVNGASGAVGTNAVQLAAHLGATVTGVASTANLALVERLGADHVIDHTRHDPVETTERFDVIFDTVGTLPLAAARHLLRPDGVLLLAVAGLGTTVWPRGNVVTGTAPERADDIRFLLSLVADGTLVVVHDALLGLDDIVAAHERVDSGHKVGNVVVRP